MMGFSLLVPLKSSLSRVVLFSRCGGHKEEEHDLKVSFVADAGEGGDWDSCDGVRRCVRHWGGWADNDKLEFCSPGGPVFQLATIRHQLYDSTMLISDYVVFFRLTYILMIEIWKMPSLLFQANGAAEHQSNWLRLLSVAPSSLGWPLLLKVTHPCIYYISSNHNTAV